MDLDVFEGFWPGMTRREALLSAGEADEYREQDGNRAWVYHRPGADVIVSHEHQGSFLFGKWWRLGARLTPPVLPEELLHASVVQELPPDLRRFTVVFMTRAGYSAAVVFFENGRIVRLDSPPNAAAEEGFRGRFGSHTEEVPEEVAPE